MNNTGALSTFIQHVVSAIIQPLVILIVTAGVAYFIWGIVVYLWNSEKGDERTKGAQHILWGVIGIVIMVAVVGILQIVLNTFGVQLPGH